MIHRSSLMKGGECNQFEFKFLLSNLKVVKIFYYQDFYNFIEMKVVMTL